MLVNPVSPLSLEGPGCLASWRTQASKTCSAFRTPPTFPSPTFHQLQAQTRLVSCQVFQLQGESQEEEHDVPFVLIPPGTSIRNSLTPVSLAVNLHSHSRRSMLSLLISSTIISTSTSLVCNLLFLSLITALWRSVVQCLHHLPFHLHR